MTTNRRYEARYAAQHAKSLLEASPPPCTLPQQAYGPQHLVWAKSRLPVWAWISWPDRPAERIAAFARGWNDRVVNVSWYGPRGEVDCVVWRNAVTHRSATQTAVEGAR